MRKVISLFMLLLVLATCSNAKQTTPLDPVLELLTGKKKDKNKLLKQSILAVAGLNSGGGSSSSSTPNQNPSIPTNLVATQEGGISGTSIKLTWNKSTDEGSISDYEVKLNSGDWIKTNKALTYTFTGLTIGTTYNLQVKAKDNANAYSDIAQLEFTPVIDHDKVEKTKAIYTGLLDDDKAGATDEQKAAAVRARGVHQV